MTKVFDLLKALIASPWLPLAAAIVLAFLLVRDCNRADRAEDEVKRQTEAADLSARDLLVARQGLRDAEKRAADLEAQDVVLAAELERARQGARSAHAALAEALRTGSLVAGGTPRPSQSTIDATSRPPAASSCLLAAGDSGELRVNEVHLVTADGNRIVAGTGEAWRLRPGPETRLFGGPFRADLSSVAVEPDRRSPGWGGGARITLGRDGTLYGVAISPPPFRLPVLGWSSELVADGVANASGAWQLGAALMVRP